MKKLSITMGLFIALSGITHAQKLKAEEIEIELTKDGKKALKKEPKGKAEFTNFGQYSNEDSSEFYQVYIHQYKDEPKQYEIHTINENAEEAEVKTGQFTPGFLKPYGVEKVEQKDIDRVPAIDDTPYAYLKRRALALKGPEVRKGHFEIKYYEGVWSGFEFKVDEEYDLEEIFWPDVKVSVSEGNVSNQNYLVAKRTTLGRVLQGDRNYVPVDGKILAAGPKAVSEQNQWLYGIYSFKTRSWDKKQTITFDDKISGALTQITTEVGVTVLINKGEQPHLIHFTKDGEIEWQKTLRVDDSKKYLGWAFVKLDDGKLLLYASKLVSSPFNPKYGMMTYVMDGSKMIREKFYDYESFDEKLVEAPKSDVKLKKISNFTINQVKTASNGDLLFVMGSNLGEAIMQLDAGSGNLKHLYITDAVSHAYEKATKQGPGQGYQTPLLKEIEPGVYYYVVRNTPESLTLGMHKDVSSTTGGNIKTITTTVYRVDDTQTRFNVHRINFNTGEISRAYEGENFTMIGDDPAKVTKSGKLYIPCFEGGAYYNLLIE